MSFKIKLEKNDIENMHNRERKNKGYISTKRSMEKDKMRTDQLEQFVFPIGNTNT